MSTEVERYQAPPTPVSVAEVERQRRLADAELDVAKRAKLSDEDLVPLMRNRLDAWRDWGLALGPPMTREQTGGVTASNTSGADRIDQHRARKIAAVREPVYQARRARENPDELTLAALLRDDKEAERDDKRDGNEQLVEQAPRLTDISETFPTIMLDPPWDWGDEGDVDQYGRATPTYATMPIAEVAAQPIGELAEPNAHLYLWITNRSLPKGFALLERWGFRYVTTLTWVKPSIGMGNYYRGSTEHVLFGVRGSQALLRNNVGTHFQAPRRSQHSGKPDEFYELVETCSPGPWLEWPARRRRNGWVTVGAEVT